MSRRGGVGDAQVRDRCRDMAGSLIDDKGLWAQRGPARATQRAALFLDRDGVIVEEIGYLRRVEDVRLIPGAASAIARANAQGIPVVVITNQSGIARGLYGWDEFAAVQEAIAMALADNDAQLDLVLACGYHDIGQGPLAVSDHAWRKPNPGMFLKARDMLGLRLDRSLIVGDRVADLEAGRRAGLLRGVLVRTGYGHSHEHLLTTLQPPFVAMTADALGDTMESALAYLGAQGDR